MERENQRKQERELTILELGETLKNIREEDLDESVSAVFLTTEKNAPLAMQMAGMVYEGEISLSEIGFCKIETQQECLAGAFHVPKYIDVLGVRYKIQFFINRRHIVIINDDGFADRLIMRIRRRRRRQGSTREQFLYNFITQFISRDQEMLGLYERRLMALEEEVSNGRIQEFQNDLIPIRRELLTLRSYYDELMDMGKQLEENENHFFARKHVKYFGTVADRADRLMGKTAQLLEYAQQVRDAYQAQVDAVQNKNMQFLTVVSTVFYPLTLITGWFGMNFRDMPGLEDGYPGVVLLSIGVVIFIIILFKKKKFF